MLRGGQLDRALCSVTLLVACVPVFYAQARADFPKAPFVSDGLGKGAVSLDGPWQFHLGDDNEWANPGVDDATGHNGWEQLTADQPWGAQGHRGYDGYAWYRRHINVSPAPGASPDFAILIPAIDDVYEIYWNGRLMGHLGTMSPRLVAYIKVPPQTFGLGPIRTGVLAIRVFRLPMGSNDNGISGGFEGMPLLGGPEAIATAKGDLDFRWLRSQQFNFGLSSIYGLVFLFSFVSWLRDRSQRLHFWTASYSLMLLVSLPLDGLRFQYNSDIQQALRLVWVAIRENSLWFLLLWLLRLNDMPRVARALRVVSIVNLVGVALDSLLYFLYPSLIGVLTYQIADAALTCIYFPLTVAPVVLAVIAFVRRQRLDSARLVVAVFAFLNTINYDIQNFASQGSRFTHWTLADTLSAPVLSLNGSPINSQLILRTLLLLSIIYAVIRYSIENGRNQNALEQDLRNARAVQQVLIPEAIPQVPGFAVNSFYKPAGEVGGDFFQILATANGGVLAVIGDVSGKGMPAAMTVSLLVGTVRTLAHFTHSPGAILSAMNQRMLGRSPLNPALA